MEKNIFASSVLAAVFLLLNCNRASAGHSPAPLQPAPAGKAIAELASGETLYAHPPSADWSIESDPSAHFSVFTVYPPGTKKLELSPNNIKVVYWVVDESAKKSASSIFQETTKSSGAKITELNEFEDYKLVRYEVERAKIYRVLAVRKSPASLIPIKKWNLEPIVVIQSTAHTAQDFPSAETHLKEFIKAFTKGPKPKVVPTDFASYPFLNISEPAVAKGLSAIADAGDVAAMTQLALFKLMAKDMEGGGKLLKAAADKGFEHAQYNFGIFLSSYGGGYTGGTSPAESDVYLEKAAVSGDPWAQLALIQIHLRQSGPPNDKDWKTLHELAEQGALEAQLLLASRGKERKWWKVYLENAKGPAFTPSVARFAPTLSKYNVESSERELRAWATCDRVSLLEPPAADQPNAKESAELADCDSYGLYLGLGKAPDFTKARKCAFARMVSNSDQPDTLNWRATLMAIMPMAKGFPAISIWLFVMLAMKKTRRHPRHFNIELSISKK